MTSRPTAPSAGRRRRSRALGYGVLLAATLSAGPTASAAPAAVTGRPLVDLARVEQPAPAAWPRHAPVERPAPVRGVWPLRPRPDVVAGFDPPATRWGAGHRGVDLAGSPFAAVRSALPGTVTFAGSIAGRGVVVVSHGSTRTTYEPVAATVEVGDRVTTGALLGRLQLFGSHCFPRWCLHWGLVEGRDHYLYPLPLVGAAPVRLLPLAGFGGVER